MQEQHQNGAIKPGTESGIPASTTPASTGPKRNYKGFVAGVFSGIAKLSGMYFSLAI